MNVAAMNAPMNLLTLKKDIITEEKFAWLQVRIT